MPFQTILDLSPYLPHYYNSSEGQDNELQSPSHYLAHYSVFALNRFVDETTVQAMKPHKMWLFVVVHHTAITLVEMQV